MAFHLGAGINISPNATRLFNEWAILCAFEGRSTDPDAAFTRSYEDHAELSNQRLGGLMGEMYSTPYLIIHRVDLHSILPNASTSISVSTFMSLASIILNPRLQQLMAGAMLPTQPLEQMAKDPHAPRDSGDHVFRVTVKISDTIYHHEDLVHLVQPPCINFRIGPDSFCMAYPLKRDDVPSLTLNLRP